MEFRKCIKCGSDNPNHAKFCRKCGNELDLSKQDILKRLINDMKQKVKIITSDIMNTFASSEKEDAFTPEVFSTIQLNPKSIFKIRFQIKYWFVGLIFSSIALFMLDYYGILYDVESVFADLFWGWWYISDCLLIALGMLITLTAYRLYLNIWKCVRFHSNVDYIETRPFFGNMVRIAKKSKLGLFDNKSKKVRLTTNYSNITIFDDNHILLERDDKVGLYSIELRKIIIPVKYNRIAPFHNYMTSACIGNKDEYFDIKGNRIR